MVSNLNYISWFMNLSNIFQKFCKLKLIQLNSYYYCPFLLTTIFSKQSVVIFFSTLKICKKLIAKEIPEIGIISPSVINPSNIP